MSRIALEKIAISTLALFVFAACGEPEEADNQDEEEVDAFHDDCTAGFSADDDYQSAVNEAFIDAEEGAILCFYDGDYSFDAGLSIRASDVQIWGESRDGVRLDFSDDDSGSRGIDVQNADDFVIRSVSVLNSADNGIEVRNATGVTIDDVRVGWEGDPTSSNGDYGLYPVESENVLVENSVVHGASDAGIYLGQSENGIIRHNEVYENVAGIEVENTSYVDVHDNEVYDNTGGILIFNLPDLARAEGDNTRVFDNEVIDNNRDNFSGEDAGIVDLVPAGSATFIVGVQDVEMFGNHIENHDSVSLAAISFDTLTPFLGDYDRDEYYLYAERIDIHSNTVIDSGSNPQDIADQLVDVDPVPAVIWDGVYNDEVDEEDRLNCFSGNVDGDGDPATYAHLAYADEDHENHDQVMELGPQDCEREPLPAVDF